MLFNYRSNRAMDLGLTLSYGAEVSDNRLTILTLASVVGSAYSHDNHVIVDADLDKKIYILKYTIPKWRI